MKALLISLSLLLASMAAQAQTKPAATTPPAVVSVVEGVAGKHFVPDTTYTALTQEDQTLLAKEPVANWSLAQESGQNMTYYNLVVGTRSYQLLITPTAKSAYPTATLLRYTTPKSKPEAIARGTLRPKEGEKGK